ncbi:MAG: hypothetical protein KGQ61_06010 [Planctomycetes bacterium]|nr:hypothetical protein [Planctomycetota bacterium]
MQRFVLRFTGQGAPPAADLERISAASGVSVIDATPRMVLVEASGAAGGRLADALAGWICVPEHGVSLPEPRPRPVKSPESKPKPPGRSGSSRAVRGDRRGGRSKPGGER